MDGKDWWIVVGGARRLGLALARRLAHGRSLVLTSSRARGAGAESSDLANLPIGADARFLHWDAGDPNLASVMMTDLERLRGEGICLGGALMVAGTFPFAPFGSWGARDLRRTWQVNLTFPFLAAQALAPHIKDGGCLQFILDTCIHRPMLNRLPYSAAKSGLASLVYGLAQLLAPNIRVVGHAIGAVLPEEGSNADFLRNQTLLKSLGSPEELCRAIEYADASPSLTGEIITLDGGGRWA
jgi:NAD(P)-dependent dehydrogenase (short-subunit alcohol dehydrogenase family)